MLEKVQNAVIQANEDLSKQLELLRKFRPKQLTFGSEEPKPLPATSEYAEEKIKLLIDKGLGVTINGLESMTRKYLPFPDKSVWYMVR